MRLYPLSLGVIMRSPRQFSSMAIKAVLLLMVVCCAVSRVQAQQQEELFFTRSCDEYSSPEAFVKKAVLVCLKTRDSRKCERRAAEFFSACGFEGNYRAMSAKANSSILMLMLLQDTPNVKASMPKGDRS